MSANIRSSVVRRLDRRAEQVEQVTEDQAQDPSRVSRVLSSLLRDIADLKRRWAPRRIDFEDVAVGATGSVSLNHGFGARVRWYVVDWQPTTPGNAPNLRRADNTTTMTLVLTSATAGTVTIRVEEAG